MKKTTLARLLALLLVAIMAVSVLAACGGGGAGGNGDEEEKIEFNGKPDLDPSIAAKDYNGYEFTFICQPYMDSNAYSVNYMVSDGETQNVLLDAVYRRNE